MGAKSLSRAQARHTQGRPQTQVSLEVLRRQPLLQKNDLLEIEQNLLDVCMGDVEASPAMCWVPVNKLNRTCTWVCS